MSRRTTTIMSKGGIKGPKGARRSAMTPPTQPSATAAVNEHNNNSQKAAPTSQPPCASSCTSSTSAAARLQQEPQPLPTGHDHDPLVDVDVEVVDDDDEDLVDDGCEADEEVDVEVDVEDDDDDEYEGEDGEPDPRVQLQPRNHPNPPNYLASSSEEEDDDDEEGEGDDSLDRDESEDEDDEDEDDDEGLEEPQGFLLNADGDPANIQGIPPDAQARLEAFFEAAGFTDGKLMSDPENLRKLTLTVSSALGEASAAINRMRDSQRKSLEEGRNDSMEEGDSLLALACSSGYFELARVLLAMGANVDDRGSKGDLTPLMDAASQGHLEIVKLLISHGADVNAQSACGNSPLMYAAAAGHEEIVRELLKGGAHVEDNNENGHTPLMEAASSGHVGVAKILLENGAGINTSSNEFKESALTVACYKGHLEMVRFLLSAGADQQHKTDEMHTALMEASMDGHCEVAKLLLDCGAQVNMPVDSFESPLTLAACGGHVDLAELLISRGANIEEVNDEGYTPLMEASREGHLNVVRCLLKAGGNINAETDETHESALTLSSCGGFLEVVDTLVGAGADIELGASTPLMEASQEGHYQVVRYLLDKGANIHRETQTGDTALSYACENGHVEVVQLLIEHGANPEHLSEGGRTPLMKACRGGHMDVIRFLLQKGVDVNRQTASNDHTPLSLACAGGHLSAVEALLVAGANPYHRLKDNSTMIIEAARGGHTNVIKALLDHKGIECKQPKTIKAPTAAQKAQADAAKTKAAAAGANNQGKSVLRKSRSTSTLDSSQQANQKTGSTVATTTDVKSGKMPASMMTSIPLDSPLLKNVKIPAVGKVTSTTTTNKNGEEIRKKPIQARPPGPPPPSSQIAATHAKPATAASATSQPQPAATANVQANHAPAHGEDGNEQVAAASRPKTPDQQQMPKKAAAAVEPISPSEKTVTASATTPSSTTAAASATATTSPGGRPLQPSQVTAATAISERPKATAKKPSARKQQQGQSQSTQPPPATHGTVAMARTTVGGAGDGNANGTSASPNASSSFPGFPSQMLQMQVQQIFVQHQPQLIFKERGGSTGSGNLTYDNQPELIAADLANVLASSTLEGLTVADGTNPLVLAGVGVSASETFITTESGGVTFTGANEVILGADLPIICYPPVGGGGGDTTTTVQVKTHPVAVPKPHLNIDLSAAAAAASAVKPHHPPALPTAFTEAAVAAGLIPPSGLPPKQQNLQRQPAASPKPKVAQVQTQTQPPLSQKEKLAATAKALQAPVSSGGAKKQTAKRTRPFSQGPAGHHGCPNNHKGCSGHQAVATQTSNSGDKNVKALDLDSATDSNGETSLSIAAGQGHLEVVEFLLQRHAHIEHRDKKGYTPLILSADGGHDKVCSLLLDHGADVEAQSERTKDTALSLACTKGRYEVVELLLKRGANKEHRNVSDYTPLSLAASGGFVNIIKLLLQSGAEINSRTGSKLGISPLMLAAMNGNTAAVKLLLDMGSDINAQIETNKNTALTLACFQGRHEVVQLLLDRKANLEHRAKTGLTPLMEAANGGYVDVGRILIEKGADVNAPPVPATRDTALTIAADKGHFRFVEMLIAYHANVEVRNKKGCTPLWLACNGGHLDVCQALQKAGSDVDAQDNRRISCLMTSFKKGHVKVVRWIVRYVKQFPSDSEMSRYFLSLSSEPELLKRAQQCMEHIKQAKDKQALEASKNANILLEELEMEKNREESKKLAAAKRREKKKKKKQEKKQLVGDDERDEADDDEDEMENEDAVVEMMDSGVDVNSTSSNASSLDKKQKGGGKGGKINKENIQIQAPPLPVVPPVLVEEIKKSGNKKGKEEQLLVLPPTPTIESKSQHEEQQTTKAKGKKKKNKESVADSSASSVPVTFVESLTTKPGEKEGKKGVRQEKEILKEKAQENDDAHHVNKGKGKDKKIDEKISKQEEPRVPPVKETVTQGPHSKKIQQQQGQQQQDPSVQPALEALMSIALNPPHRKNNFEGEAHPVSQVQGQGHPLPTPAPQPTKPASAQQANHAHPKSGRKDDGWKEVTRNCPSSRSKKVMVPSSVISRVIGRGGCNINAIREVTSAHIEVEKQQKGHAQPERTIQIKGTVEASKQAYNLITALMNEPDVDIKKLIPQYVKPSTSGGSGSSSTSSNPSVVPNVQSGAFPAIVPASVSSLPSTGNSSSPALGGPASAPIITGEAKKKDSSGSVKSSSISPPVTIAKSGSSSPPMRKPNSSTNSSANNAGNFEIGNFSVSEVPVEIYSKNYIGKKSMVFTNSGVGGGSSATSHHGGNPASPQGINWCEVKAKNSTPIIAGGGDVKHTNVSGPTAPPFGSSTAAVTTTSVPSESPVAVNVGSHHHQHHQGQRQQLHKAPVQSGPHVHGQQQHIINSSSPYPQTKEQQHDIVGHHGHGQQIQQSQYTPPSAPAAVNQTVGSSASSPGEPYSPTVTGPPRNLAPGTLAVGSNRGGVAVGGRSPNELPSSGTPDQPQQQTLEYSPFNYTFSKTSTWFPGDLAVRDASQSQQGGNYGMRVGIDNASRGMNFASVAASGISSSMSTTTAQMTVAAGENIIGKIPSAIDPSIAHGHGRLSGPGLVESMDKSDMTKAPGYRGNNMGSPILRMQQQQQAPQQPMTNLHGSSNYSLDMASLSSTGMSTNSGMYSRTGNFPMGSNSQYQHQQHHDLGMMGSSQSPQPMMSNGGSGSHIMHQQQQQNNSGISGVVGQQIPAPQLNTNTVTATPPQSMTVIETNPPTNVLSSRLNPRAPSFMGKVVGPGGHQQGQGNTQHMPSQLQHPPSPATITSTAIAQANQFIQQFKNLSSAQYPTNTGRLGSNHWAYNNGSLDDLAAGFQGLASLSGGGPPPERMGMMENTFESQGKADDRRFPRPIGGERNWKSGAGTGVSGAAGLSAVGGPTGNLPYSDMNALDHQSANWLGLYGSQSQPDYSNQGQGHGLPSAPRNDRIPGILGRRFVDDMDATRLLDIQQQQVYDGQPLLLNGGNISQMMHMQQQNNSIPLNHPVSGGMYPFGMDHLDQQTQAMPKLEQQWGSHLLMDDKHLQQQQQQGWGTKWN